MEGRITPEQFRRLKTGEIFTFGANEAFRHGKGSAKTALKWGAIYFKGPFCGNTYGICTKDKNIKTLSLDKIKVHVDNFIAFTKDHPDLTFLVVKIGCMLAGYKPKDIAPLFKEAIELVNIHLPLEFWEILIPKPIIIVKQSKLF